MWCILKSLVMPGVRRGSEANQGLLPRGEVRLEPSVLDVARAKP